MDQQYEDNIVQARLLRYKEGLGKFKQSMPALVDQYHAFTESCFAEGHLKQKQKHLIALGISMYAQDDDCIIYHTKGCLDRGCTHEEILETIGVTTAIGGGTVMSRGVTLIQQCLDEFTKQTH